MTMLLTDIPHPYPRYGLAVALLQGRLKQEEFESAAPEVLAQAIEMGLEHLRLATDDKPDISDVLRFAPIKLEELQRNIKLVQSAGLANQGNYLAPTIVTTDGDAKGTYDNAIEIIDNLRQGDSLESIFTFSRSFAPTTAKINNGKSSQSPPKGMLFEAAYSAITTLTRIKPAAWVNGRNTVIIPDLPLNELRDFVELFTNMMASELDGNLLEAKLPPKLPPSDAPKQAKRKKKTESSAPKSEYRRPRIFNGNYPFAPREAAFGAAGLLGAIGKWAKSAGKIEWARRVLESIAGTDERPGRPLYIISYDAISQAQFTHYVVNLSIEGKLSELIDSLSRDTKLYADLESNRPRRDTPAYQLFYLMANRFLQLFTLPSFRDFLSTRAEYSPNLQPLFREYFMYARKINKEIVESARLLGQWLNRTAYVVADSEVKPDTSERTKKVQKEKAKILVEFESAAMSAKTPQDMLYRISTRAGRLLQRDAPAEATRFMDATASGEIEPEDALHLLVAYMRLRTPAAKTEAPDGYGSDGDSQN